MATRDDLVEALSRSSRVGRHNVREADTLDQMGVIAYGLRGRRQPYGKLVTDNGLPNGTRCGGERMVPPDVEIRLDEIPF